jgi:dipeptidyl aminopeptidase/acylaminoacyl peptidase
MQPSWAPDGTRLAVSGAPDGDPGNPENATRHIFTYVPGTDGETQITTGTGESWPAWSPDGRRIAFQRDDARQLAVRDLASGVETSLSGGASGDFEPEWSPDGSRILFRHGHAISEMNADGSDRRDLHVQGASAVWAPDGERIAYFGFPSGALTVLDLRARRKLVLYIAAGPERISWQRLGPAAYRGAAGKSDCPYSLSAPLRVRQGTARGDRIVATHGTQWIEALGGNDHVSTGAAFDYVEGDGGNDWIATGGDRDRINGGAGNDVLYGESGGDTIDGGTGRDRIFGGPGLDSISANDGARDVIRCGSGHDWVVADARDVVAKDCEDVTRVRR